MRAKEFIFADSSVNEVAPFVAALGSALTRGATAVGNAALKTGASLAKGAANVGSKVAQGVGNAASAVGNKVVQGATNTAMNAGIQALGTIGSSTSPTTSQDPNKNKPATPINVPPGTKIEIAPSTDPNKLTLKVGGANLSMDMKNPENSRILQQLGQIGIK